MTFLNSLIPFNAENFQSNNLHLIHICIKLNKTITTNDFNISISILIYARSIKNLYYDLAKKIRQMSDKEETFA